LNPALLVIAGPNGSGKTTITVQLREERWSQDTEYLNPDDVARDTFGDWNSAESVLNAARFVTARREQLLVQRAGIAFETVFSTAEKLEFLARAKNSGYFVRLFFVGTSDPCINAARVAGRMLQGGHAVPIEKILSRYEKSMRNLKPACTVADRVYIYDNSVSDQGARLCARVQEGCLRKVYGDLPEWVSDATCNLEPHAAFVDVRAAS
jgi:predicted ABC-type ATPase